LNSVLEHEDAIKIGKEFNVEMIPTAVFGPTCDGLDTICTLESTKLPRCEVNDWLIFENQGAYTHTASFVFNGYTHIPKKHYCYSFGNWAEWIKNKKYWFFMIDYVYKRKIY